MSAGRKGYELAPTTPAGLRRSAAAQVKGMGEQDYDPVLDGVVLTPQAVLDLCNMVYALRDGKADA